MSTGITTVYNNRLAISDKRPTLSDDKHVRTDEMHCKLDKSHLIPLLTKPGDSCLHTSLHQVVSLIAPLPTTTELAVPSSAGQAGPLLPAVSPQ